MPNSITFLIPIVANLAGMLLIYSVMASALTRLRRLNRGIIGVITAILIAEFFWMVPGIIEEGIRFGPVSRSFCFANWLVSTFGIVIFCQAVKGIPRQLLDSACLDGLGSLAIFWNVVLPYVGRQLVYIALMTLVTTLLCTDSPLLALFQTQIENSVSGIGAMLLISVILTFSVIVIFLIVRQRFDERSITSASLSN